MGKYTRILSQEHANASRPTGGTMRALRHVVTLRSMQRRVIATMAFVLALTSTHVQAADMGRFLPDTPQWETGRVEPDDLQQRGIVVPLSLNGSLEGSQDVPVIRRAYASITAYSSTPQETDDSPFITADGSHVSDGVIAANWLKFGTRVRIPQLSGGKVYVVHDRMHSRFSDRIDVWVDSVAKARNIGFRKNYTIEILHDAAALPGT